MKKLLAVSASAVIALAPAIGVACEYHDAEKSASVTPPVLASASPAPEATKVPAPSAAKALPQKATQPAVVKAKAAQPDQKVAALAHD